MYWAVTTIAWILARADVCAYLNACYFASIEVNNEEKVESESRSATLL